MHIFDELNQENRLPIDLEGIRTFLAIHRAGGFARACQVLHRSQPAISRRIALLEDVLGVPLFERGVGGLRLTTAGQVLVPYAEKAVAALQDCEAAIDGLRDGRLGRIDLVVVGTLAGSGLTRILQRFVDAHPRVDLKLRTATSREVSRLVRSGEATIGLRYHADSSEDLDCEQVATERLVVACRTGHPKLRKRKLKLVDLAGEAWLVFPDAENRERSSDNLIAQFNTRGHSEIRWTAIDSLTAQKRLVEVGLGLALLPESAIDEERKAGRIASLRVGDLSAFNPVCLVTRRDGYLSPASRNLIDLVRRRNMFEESG